jgi:hypothetical protein
MAKIRALGRGSVFICGCALTLLIITGTNEAGSDETLIRPGIGVGEIRLGDSLADVYAKLGQKKADSARKVGKGEMEEIWLSYRAMGLTFAYDRKKTLKKIIVTSKAIPLERVGLRVGSRAAYIERYYETSQRRVRKIAGRDNMEFWEYAGQGITFTVDTAEDRIDVITVMRRR